MVHHHLTKVEHDIVDSGLLELRDHLLMIIQRDFKSILRHKEMGLSSYQIWTGNILLKIGTKFKLDDVIQNPTISLLLSLSLTEILGGQNVNVSTFKKEVYPDMCGSKRTIEGFIDIDLSSHGNSELL